jgi:hypothetical protein
MDTGDPWATRDPSGHGIGLKNEPVMGMGYLAGFIQSSRVRVWDSETRWVCARCQPYVGASDPVGRRVVRIQGRAAPGAVLQPGCTIFYFFPI